LLGDEIVVRTWISEMGKVASRRRFAICRPQDKTVLARGETRWAMVDLNARQAIAIPPDILLWIVVLERPPILPWESGSQSE
jgi:acyl-CoA thioesterase FadM